MYLFSFCRICRSKSQGVEWMSAWLEIQWAGEDREDDLAGLSHGFGLVDWLVHHSLLGWLIERDVKCEFHFVCLYCQKQRNFIYGNERTWLLETIRKKQDALCCWLSHSAMLSTNTVVVADDADYDLGKTAIFWLLMTFTNINDFYQH